MKKKFITIILTGLFLAALSSCAPHKTCATYAQSTKTQKINKTAALSPKSLTLNAKR